MSKKTRLEELPPKLLWKFALTLGVDDLLNICNKKPYFRELLCESDVFQRIYAKKYLTTHQSRIPKGYTTLYEIKKINEMDKEKLPEHLGRKGYEVFIARIFDNMTSEDRESILISAAGSGYLDIVKYLINKNVGSIEAINDAFESAARNGETNVMIYLIERGANIHYNYDVALVLSAGRENLDFVKYLVAKGADINGDNGGPLRAAAIRGPLRNVKYLVDSGANIDVFDNVTKKLIKNREVIEYLRSIGVDI